MKNAHERFAVLEYTKRMKDTTTRIRVRLDRFIAEVDDAGNGKAHLIAALGGDSDIGAIWAAIIEQNQFTVEAPGSISSPPAWVKTRSAFVALSRSQAENPSATWSGSQQNWPRHVQE